MSRRASEHSRLLRLLAGLAAAGLLAAPALAMLKTFEPADVTNFSLGPEYAQWLVGPIAHIATAKERADYLSLSEDAEAEEFIEGFWERRGPNLEFPPTGPRTVYKRRAEEADRAFTEGTFLGRRTDRGTVFVLYGAPTSVEYADPARPGEQPILVWNYNGRVEKGLDGKRPDRRYAFRKDGLVTKLHPTVGLRNLRRLPSSEKRGG